MSLKVWLPAKEDFKNYGIGPDPIVVGTPTTDANGKIGTCMHLNSSSYIELPYNGRLVNTSSISFGGWFRINQSEINTVISGYTYDSTHPYASCQLIGNSSYGGVAIVITTNNIYNDGSFSSVNAACQMRTANGGAYQTNGTTFPFDQWIHFFYVWDKTAKILNFYKNGEKVHAYNLNKDFTDIREVNLVVNYSGTYGGNGPAYKLPFYTNDIRIYNEALSEYQIHELYKCLSIHYKLDNITHAPVNAYSYPTFETTTASGGWNHWGQSGASGTYGQNTDRQYIYFENQTYSHWVANAAEATGNYLLYQAPKYDGGIRSFQCIVKEENSRPIDENICYATWNARNGGAPNNAFTSVTPLRDGFYLCKTENLSQDGSNDLIGIYVRPGYKVYVSLMMVEDLRAFCSDAIYYRNYIVDSSGYNNHGTVYGAIDTNPYSPRHIYGTLFDGNTGAILTPFNNAIDNLNKIYSISLWFFRDAYGSKSHETLFGGPSGFEIESKEGANNNPIVKLWSWGQGYVAYTANTWNHIVFVQDGTNAKLYLNGQLAVTGTRNATIPVGNYFLAAWKNSTTQNYLGYISDFRVYANALNENDVLQLYNIPMNIDSQKNIHCYDYFENATNIIPKMYYTTSYSNHSTKAPLPQLWGDASTGCIINSNGELEFLGSQGSVGSPYIKIKPGTYYYEIDVSIATGNQFYIQLERYDLAKTARTNNAAVNLLQVKPTSDLVHQYYYGSVDLSTDGTNPCDTVALRILNLWSGSESTSTGKSTVHRLCVQPQTECKNPSLLTDGLLSNIGLKADLNENKKSAFYNTGTAEGSNIIEK